MPENPCDAISRFCDDPKDIPKEGTRDWLDHAGSCRQCADQMHASPEAAAEILAHSREQDVSEDPAYIFAPIHGMATALGTVLAPRLDGDALARLGSAGKAEADLERLRDAFRHAENVKLLSLAELRAAAALCALSLAFEGLVFARASGDAPPVLVNSHGEIRVAGHVVPTGYLAAKVAEVIGGENETVAAEALLETTWRLLREELLSIPRFTTMISAGEIRLDSSEGEDHGADSDDIREQVVGSEPWKTIDGRPATGELPKLGRETGRHPDSASGDRTNES